MGTSSLYTHKKYDFEEETVVNIEACPPRLLTEHKPWLFFAKPAGLHTVRAGKKGGGKSLEDIIPRLLPEEMPERQVFLCNRLDAATSGIVVGTYDAEAVSIWRNMEQAKQCRKLYVALVAGHKDNPPPQMWTVPFALDTHKRKISRVLPTRAETTRHTQFLHLKTLTHAECVHYVRYTQDVMHHSFHLGEECLFQDRDIHLVGCRIYQGARHQIRAHAAHSAYPLWCDVRYAQRQIPAQEEVFFLHHGALFLPDITVTCLPSWVQCATPDIQKIIVQFYEETLKRFFS